MFSNEDAVGYDCKRVGTNSKFKLFCKVVETWSND